MKLIILQLLIIVTLAMVYWQDHKDRAVSWLLFPILATLYTVYTLSFTSLSENFINILSSFVFLVTQLMVLTIYFSLKNRKLTNIANGYLGWGDILFLFALCFFLPIVNYLFFYLLTLVVVLIRQVVNHILSHANSQKIPLAGIQAFMLMILFFANLFCTGCIPFASNTFLLNLLSNE